MSSTVTLAFVVIICAIIVLFSKEWGNLIKKILAIWGMKAFLPLLLATTLVISFESGFYIIFMKIRSILESSIETLIQLLPFTTGAVLVAQVLILMCFSFLPVLAIHFWFKRKNYLFFQHAYLLNTLLWLVVAVLLTIR